MPSLALGTDGNPIVAWVDRSSPDSEIFVRRWNGTSWTEVGTGSASGGGISMNRGGSVSPALARAANGALFAAWLDASGNDQDIYVRGYLGDAQVTRISVTATDPTASETGSDTATFVISRTGSTASPVVIYYTVSGTAQPGLDYVALPGAVTLGVGVSSASVLVTPLDDAIPEDEETIIITLTTSGDYVLGWAKTATATIAPSDIEVSIVASTPLATELNQQPRLFTVSRNLALASPTVVSHSVQGIATPGQDYTALSGSVTIGAGLLSANIPVQPLDDATAELDETVLVILSTSGSYTIGTADRASVTILDNDPIVTLYLKTPTALEQGLRPAVFEVRRFGGFSYDLPIAYIVSGTATPGSDYQTLPGSLTLGAGAASATLRVVPIEDPVQEADETVVVQLLASTGYSLGSPSTTTIVVSDGGPEAWHDFGTQSPSVFRLGQTPSLVLSTNGAPIVAWTDTSLGQLEVYVRRWNGAAWVEMGAGSATQGGISNTFGPSAEPKIVLDKLGNPIVAWTDSAGATTSIYARQWTGLAWTEMGANSASGSGISLAGISDSVSIIVGADGLPIVAWAWRPQLGRIGKSVSAGGMGRPGWTWEPAARSVLSATPRRTRAGPRLQSAPMAPPL